ncbi:oxygenase MpaB family protein [Cellulomonas sp. NPDC089187]|uniref:oxygenase MpaB family protein n=1 Tax=Cellulomonas sp. NPDC089187 TaxID=3154970 RepID=UPI00341B42AD
MNLRTQLSTALLDRVAGPHGHRIRDRIHGTPGERWFDADAPIRRVHGDASMFIGGLAALLLQSWHPRAMAAVAAHSGYRGDPWGRLQRTSAFLAVTAFGTVDHAVQATRAVREIHAGISGVSAEGEPYAASDPHLLRWVHVAEVHAFLTAHQRFGAEPLDAAGCDLYVAQAARTARELGVLDPPGSVPELRAQLDGFVPELRGSAEARDAARFLLREPPLPVAARLPYRGLVLAAIGMLPRACRAPLGLADRPIMDRYVAPVVGQVLTGTIRWALAAQPPPPTPDA